MTYPASKAPAAAPERRRDRSRRVLLPGILISLACGADADVREKAALDDAALERVEQPPPAPPPVDVASPEPAGNALVLDPDETSGAPPADDGDGSGAPVRGEEPPAVESPSTPGTSLGPYPGWDEDVECYPFVAYQPGSLEKSTAFNVGLAVDRYVGFGYATPWQGTRYVRAFRTIIDNAPVLHHWILYEELGAVDGAVGEIVGAHPVGAMLQAWAPGGSDVYFTPDVGVKMSSDTGYLLELHYNSNDVAAADASGVEVCVSERAPENLAAISWLGTDAIAGLGASGTCLPRADRPIHIISAMPHMHLEGTSMKVTVNRLGGATEVVHDEPFDYRNQRFYTESFALLPGDSITTTCAYNAPAVFGRGTNEEMCYWFALAYPAGALSDGMPLGTAIHGGNACLGL